MTSRTKQISQRVHYNGWQKKDNTKHELNSLRAFLASLECHCSMKAVHLNMSHTLARLSSGEIAPQRGSSIPEKKSMSLDSLQHFIQLFFFQQSKQGAQQPFSLFSGAVISEWYITEAINTLNHSSTLSVQEENPGKTYKRIKLLYLDSDWARLLAAVRKWARASPPKVRLDS